MQTTRVPVRQLGAGALACLCALVGACASDAGMGPPAESVESDAATESDDGGSRAAAGSAATPSTGSGSPAPRTTTAGSSGNASNATSGTGAAVGGSAGTASAGNSASNGSSSSLTAAGQSGGQAGANGSSPLAPDPDDDAGPPDLPDVQPPDASVANVDAAVAALACSSKLGVCLALDPSPMGTSKCVDEFARCEGFLPSLDGGTQVVCSTELSACLLAQPLAVQKCTDEFTKCNS